MKWQECCFVPNVLKKVAMFLIQLWAGETGYRPRLVGR